MSLYFFRKWLANKWGADNPVFLEKTSQQEPESFPILIIGGELVFIIGIFILFK